MVGHDGSRKGEPRNGKQEGMSQRNSYREPDLETGLRRENLHAGNSFLRNLALELGINEASPQLRYRESSTVGESVGKASVTWSRKQEFPLSTPQVMARKANGPLASAGVPEVSLNCFLSQPHFLPCLSLQLE